VLDAPIDVTSTIGDATLVFSDRHATLTGVLQTAQQMPATDYTVIIFPADRELWRSTRRLRSARPGTDGRFVFNDVVPGDYVIAAVTDLDPDGWTDSSFLDQLAPAGLKVTVNAGGQATANLQLK
jgi:hypothetical protein